MLVVSFALRLEPASDTFGAARSGGGVSVHVQGSHLMGLASLIS